MSKSKPQTGTFEWAPETANCVLGCSNRCRYCYARASALRFKRITDPEAWGTTYNSVNKSELARKQKKMTGVVMFPDTHDITPEFLPQCSRMISNLLKAGNRLLIVSKPYMECIEALCNRFLGEHRDKIEFRFTIGARSDELLAYWEPGAPSFEERLACLELAYGVGFATSVSVEPMLDSSDIVKLFNAVEPYVTGTVWIGKMRLVKQRCIAGTSDIAIARIEEGQTDERIWEIYNALKDEPKVRWKDSIKEVIDAGQ